jgi:hypothetical protein
MTAAARGPGTCPRCLRPRPSAPCVCARPDRRALGANPRAGSLGMTAGLLEWADARSGEATLSAEWFVAMLRSLSGVRSISSSMPATENSLAELQRSCVFVDRCPHAAKLKRVQPSCRARSFTPHRGSKSFPGGRCRSCQVPGLVKKRPSNVDLTSRWMRTTCGRSWRTGLCKPRRSRSMPWRAGHPRRLTSQMRGAASASIAWRSGLRRA